jgi:hypothetical protein
MKAPLLKFSKEHMPSVEGNFEFEMGKTTYDHETFTPIKPITFYWSAEMAQDIKWLDSKQKHYGRREDELIEMLAEQLKQDFITYLKTYVPEPVNAPISPERIISSIQEPKYLHYDIVSAGVLTGEVENGNPVVELSIIFADEIGTKYEWVDENHKLLKKI